MRSIACILLVALFTISHAARINDFDGMLIRAKNEGVKPWFCHGAGL